MILDIDVTTRVMRWVSSTTTSRGATAASDPVVDCFTGDELAVRVFGPGYLVGATPLEPVSALAMRGAIVVSNTGRVGITVGSGKVVEPCGRAYALTTTNPTWWTKAWLPSSIVKTVGLAPVLAETTPTPFVTPLPVELSRGSNVCQVDTTPVAVAARPLTGVSTATAITATRTAGLTIRGTSTLVVTATRVAVAAAVGSAPVVVVAAWVASGRGGCGAAITVAGAVSADGRIAVSRASTPLPVLSTVSAGGSSNSPVGSALPATAAASGVGVVGRKGWGGTGVTSTVTADVAADFLFTLDTDPLT